MFYVFVSISSFCCNFFDCLFRLSLESFLTQFTLVHCHNRSTHSFVFVYTLFPEIKLSDAAPTGSMWSQSWWKLTLHISKGAWVRYVLGRNDGLDLWSLPAQSQFSLPLPGPHASNSVPVKCILWSWVPHCFWFLRLSLSFICERFISSCRTTFVLFVMLFPTFWEIGFNCKYLLVWLTIPFSTLTSNKKANRGLKWISKDILVR